MNRTTNHEPRTTNHKPHVDTNDGKLVWRIPYEVSYDTATITPVYQDGRIYVTSVVEYRFTPGRDGQTITAIVRRALCVVRRATQYDIRNTQYVIMAPTLIE